MIGVAVKCQLENAPMQWEFPAMQRNVARLNCYQCAEIGKEK